MRAHVPKQAVTVVNLSKMRKAPAYGRPLMHARVPQYARETRFIRPLGSGRSSSHQEPMSDLWTVAGTVRWSVWRPVRIYCEHSKQHRDHFAGVVRGLASSRVSEACLQG